MTSCYNAILKIREHYELLYANKFNNLDEIDKFMEKKLLKLIQDKIDYLESPLFKNLNLWLIFILSKPTPNPGGFTVEFYKTFNEEIRHKLFQKIEEGIFSNLF